MPIESFDFTAMWIATASSAVSSTQVHVFKNKLNWPLSSMMKPTNHVLSIFSMKKEFRSFIGSGLKGMRPITSTQATSTVK